MQRQQTLPEIQRVIAPSRVEGAVAERLQEEMCRHAGAGRCRIALDMSAVERIDSRGLAVLIQSARHARAEGGELVLVLPSPPVRNILELTRIHRSVDIVDDERAAYATLTALPLNDVVHAA